MQRRANHQSLSPANPFSRGGARITYGADSRYGPQTVKYQSKRPGTTIGLSCVGVVLMYLLLSWMSSSSALPSVPVVPIAAIPTATTLPGLDKESTPLLSPEKNHLGYKPRLQENEEERIPYNRPDEEDEEEEEGDHQRSGKHDEDEEEQKGRHRGEGQRPDERAHIEENEEENAHATMATPLEADRTGTGSDKKSSPEFGASPDSKKKEEVDTDEDVDVDGGGDSKKHATVTSHEVGTSEIEGALLNVKKADEATSGSPDKSTSFTGTNGHIESEEDEENHEVALTKKGASKDDTSASTSAVEATSTTESTSDTIYTTVSKNLSPDSEETTETLREEKDEYAFAKSSSVISQDEIVDATSSTGALFQPEPADETAAVDETMRDDGQTEEKEEDTAPELPDEAHTTDRSDKVEKTKSSEGEDEISGIDEDGAPAPKILQDYATAKKEANQATMNEGDPESDQPELLVGADSTILTEEKNSKASERASTATNEEIPPQHDEESNEPPQLREEETEDSQNSANLTVKERKVVIEDGSTEPHLLVEESETVTEENSSIDVHLTKAEESLPEEDESPQLPDEEGDVVTLKIDATDTQESAKKEEDEASEQPKLPDDENSSDKREDISRATVKEASADKLGGADQDSPLQLPNDEANGIEEEQKKASDDQEIGDENQDSHSPPLEGATSISSNDESREKTPELVDANNTTSRIEVEENAPATSLEQENAVETLVGDQLATSSTINEAISDAKISPDDEANTSTKVLDDESDAVVDSESDMNSSGKEHSPEDDANLPPKLPDQDDKESSAVEMDQVTKEDERDTIDSTQAAAQTMHRHDSSVEDSANALEEAASSESHKVATAVDTEAASDSQPQSEDHSTEDTRQESPKSVEENEDNTTESDKVSEAGTENEDRVANTEDSRKVDDEVGLNKTNEIAMSKLKESAEVLEEDTEKGAAVDSTIKEDDKAAKDDTTEVTKTAGEGVATQQLDQSFETTEKEESEGSAISDVDVTADAATTATEKKENEVNQDISTGMGESDSSRLESKDANAEQSGNLRGSKTSNEELLDTASSATERAR